VHATFTTDSVIYALPLWKYTLTLLHVLSITKRIWW